MAQEITVALADHWHVFLQEAVDRRRFASPEEVIQAGLRALEAEEARSDLLDRLLEEGERSGDAGEWNLTQFLEERRREADREAA